MKFINTNVVKKLVIRISHADLQAVESLLDYTKQKFLIIATNLLIDKSKVEDVLNELYYNVVKYSPTFNNGKNVINWMSDVTKYIALKYNKTDKLLMDEENSECNSITN